jgi:hypothetical protein
MIGQFIKGLRLWDVAIDQRDIADILWLALHFSAAPRTIEPSPSQDILTGVRSSATATPQGRARGIPESAITGHKVQVVQSAEGTGIYVPTRAHGGVSATRASVVRVPTVAALPGAPLLARSLRPLMRKFRSGTRFDFDAEATVDRFAHTGLLAPVLRPREERWFDIALVIDDGPSMTIWQQAIVEMYQMLGRHGAFRDVRRWTMAASQTKLELASESGLVCGWRELIDPHSRRIILLVSDCIGSYWDDGSIWEMIAGWGQATPTALVQVLPERLWRITAIGDISSLAWSELPGTPNTNLLTEEDWFLDEGQVRDIPIPTMTLSPLSMGAWANLVMARGDTAMPYVMARTPDREHAANVELGALTPERRVNRYREIVSPVAYQLAVYFSAVPLTLPVMRVIQRVMLPNSDSSHLAEFFLGGLVERVTDRTSRMAAEEVEYDFVAGVRDILQTSMLRSQAFEVLAAVSKYLEQHLGESFDFRALVPDEEGNYQLSASAKPFATIGANLLRRIGRPTGRRLFSLRNVQPVFEEEFVAGITIRETLSLARNVQKLSWSPNGQKLTLLLDGEIRTVWAGSGEIAAEFSTKGDYTALCWLTDMTLACGMKGPSIVLLGEKSRSFGFTSAEERSIALGPYEERGGPFLSDYHDITEMAFSDGRLAVAFSHDALAYFRMIVDWRPEAPIPRVPGDRIPYGGAVLGSVSWPANLSFAAILSTDGMLRIYDQGSRPLYEHALDPRRRIDRCTAAWSRDGRTLVAYWRNLLTVLSVDPNNVSRAAIHITVRCPRLETLSFSSDGRYLIGVGDRFALWLTDSWQLVAERPLPDNKPAKACFSPTGREVALAIGTNAYLLRVPESFATRDKAPATAPVKVFVSCSSKDARLARMLIDRLQLLDREGWSSTWSPLDLQPSSGREFQQIVDAHLLTSNVFLALVSPSYLSSPWAPSEMERARASSKEIVSVLLERVVRNPLTAYQMLPRNAIPISQWESEDRALDESVSELRSLYARVRDTSTARDTRFAELLSKIPADRSRLRRWIEEVGTTDGRHVLVVTGERGSGKSFTTQILAPFSDAGRFQVITTDLRYETNIDGTDDLLRAIGVQGFWDVATVPVRRKIGPKAYHEQGIAWIRDSVNRHSGSLVLVFDGLDSVEVSEDVRTFIVRLARMRFPSNLYLVLIGSLAGSVESIKNAVVERLGSAPKESNTLPRLQVLVVGTGSYELPFPVQKAAFQVGSAVARLDYGLITGGWGGVDHVAARAFAEARSGKETPLVDRLLQIVEGSQNPDFKGGAIERVDIGEGYNQAIQRADIVVLIGGAGGTWVAFRHAIAANRPVIPLMKTGTDAEAAGMLLLALGQDVIRELITADFGDDVVAARSGRLIEKCLAAHDKKQSKKSIDNSNLLWMVDTILPTAGLYLRKQSGYEDEADQIRDGFRTNKMPSSVYKRLAQTLIESSDRTWRVAGYIAIEGRPSADYFEPLFVSQGLEEKEALDNIETRPLWRWLVAISRLVETNPKRVPSTLLNRLRELSRTLQSRREVDLGG